MVATFGFDRHWDSGDILVQECALEEIARIQGKVVKPAESHSVYTWHVPGDERLHWYSIKHLANPALWIPRTALRIPG
jgi:hypothetical protein